MISHLFLVRMLYLLFLEDLKDLGFPRPLGLGAPARYLLTCSCRFAVVALRSKLWLHIDCNWSADLSGLRRGRKISRSTRRVFCPWRSTEDQLTPSFRLTQYAFRGGVCDQRIAGDRFLASRRRSRSWFRSALDPLCRWGESFR